jgi:hypothetical protein
MQKKIKYGLLGLQLVTAQVYAGQYFSIVKDATTQFPTNILLNTQSVGDYLVTNTSGSTRNVYLRDLSADFTQTSATDTSIASCGASPSFSLANGASCILRLAYQSAVVTSINQNLPTICPTSTYPTGCVYPAASTQFNVVASPTASMTTLTPASSSALFTPGLTTEIRVTNAGTNTANDISIILPSNLQSYLNSSAVTRCNTIAPGASCTFTLPMASTLPLGTELGSLSIEAANAPALSLPASVPSSLVSLQSLTFTAPDNVQTIELTNNGPAMSAMSLTIATGLTDVTATSASTTCGTTLAANSNCVYAFTATPDAHGQATASLHYTQNGIQADISATLGVNHTTVAINPNSENVGQDIIGNVSNGGGDFSIKNTGGFTWIEPEVTRSTTDTWLTLDADNCTDELKPGETCDVTYAIDGEHDLSSVIKATGQNINDTEQNLEPDTYVSIGTEGDTAFQHLQYRAVKITNLTSYAQTLSAITAAPPTNLASKITLCNGTAGDNCNAKYVSTCTDTAVIPASGSCHLWYKAESNAALSVDSTPEEIGISATVTPPTGDGTAKTLSKSVNFSYGNRLYTSGYFAAGSVSAGISGIGQWDGTTWRALAGGISNSYNTSENATALTVSQGDLYAGGGFSDVGSVANTNNIASWNGSAWSALGTSGIGTANVTTVTALTEYQGNLVVGGDFADAGGVSAVNNIAQWNGSEWSALGGGRDAPVYSLAASDDILYVGTSSAEEGISEWDGDAFTTLGGGIADGAVKALTVNGADLYAGGTFSSVKDSGDNDVAKTSKLAKWTGSSWASITTTPLGSSDFINALANNGTTVYAGGSFGTINGVSGTSKIAQYNGTTWSQMAGGVTSGSQIYALFANTTTLYEGGRHSRMSGLSSTSGLAQWNGTTWSGLGVDSPGWLNLAVLVAPHLSLT